jgi:hypothetical protein
MTIDRQLEDAIQHLLDVRSDGSSVSINEAAKYVGGPRWRSLEKPVRRVASDMAQAGKIVITAPRSTTDILKVNSPVRFRRPI